VIGRALLGRIRRRLRPRPAKPLILAYHRVADVRVDPWELAGALPQQPPETLL